MAVSRRSLPLPDGLYVMPRNFVIVFVGSLRVFSQLGQRFLDSDEICFFFAFQLADRMVGEKAGVIVVKDDLVF